MQPSAAPRRRSLDPRNTLHAFALGIPRLFDREPAPDPGNKHAFDDPFTPPIYMGAHTPPTLFFSEFPMNSDGGFFGLCGEIVAVFTTPSSVRTDTADFAPLSPGDVVQFLSRPGERQTITRVWVEHDGAEVADIRDENGWVLTVLRSYLRPVLSG